MFTQQQALLELIGALTERNAFCKAIQATRFLSDDGKRRECLKIVEKAAWFRLNMGRALMARREGKKDNKPRKPEVQHPRGAIFTPDKVERNFRELLEQVKLRQAFSKKDLSNALVYIQLLPV